MAYFTNAQPTTSEPKGTDAKQTEAAQWKPASNVRLRQCIAPNDTKYGTKRSAVERAFGNETP